jgi:AcrR family transcriptional regulator
MIEGWESASASSPARGRRSTSRGSRRQRSPTSRRPPTSPVGNVYYYFKTKDELVAAAIDSHTQDFQAMLDSLQSHRSPPTRLKALVRELTSHRELAARYGCPLGSLCSELDKQTDGLDRTCAELLQLPIEWAERQFRQLGRRDAGELAFALIASYQGIALLTNTFRDPELMHREALRLERWIDSLA